jgi:hypothetical protein
MEPNQQPPSDLQDDPAQQRIDQATDDLEASLLTPLPPSQIAAPRSSMPSEMEAIKDLVSTLVTRVDQLARTLGDVFSRNQQVTDQQLQTMRLEQELIARSDELQATQGDQIDRLETLVAALVKINANLSEIVAALLGKDNNNQGA